MRINLFGERNTLGGGRHFGEFADAMRSLRLIGDAVFEFDYFNADDHRRMPRCCRKQRYQYPFLQRQCRVPGRPSPRPGHGFPAGISIGPSSRPRSWRPSTVEWLALADLVFVPSAWGKECSRGQRHCRRLHRGCARRCGPGKVPSLLARDSYAKSGRMTFTVCSSSASSRRRKGVSRTARRLCEGIRQ